MNRAEQRLEEVIHKFLQRSLEQSKDTDVSEIESRDGGKMLTLRPKCWSTFVASSLVR